ncbi:MAG TPA: site-specific integrase [Streptosporangiaceae bacterium]|jgi:integrase
MGRRSPGEGSVWPYRERNGTERWAIGHPSFGTRRRGATGEKWFTKKAAQDALRTMLVDAARGELVAPSRQQTGAYLNEWLDGLQVKPSTLASYRANVRLHIDPAVGRVLLPALTTARINAMYRQLERSGRVERGHAGEGLSPRTVRYIHTILYGALAEAVRTQRISRNPAVAASPPSVRKAKAPEMSCWTARQLAAFLGWAADGSSTYALWHLMANTGTRRGETLALRWRDFDPDAGTLRVRRSASMIQETGEPGTMVEGDTKTGRPRVVDLDDATTALLKAHRKARGTLALQLARDDALMFGDIQGEHASPGAMTHRFASDIARCRAALGEDALPMIRLHDLRHTHATLLLLAKEPVHVVSQRLGHASPTITMSVYAHVLPGNQRQAADRFARLIREAGA